MSALPIVDLREVNSIRNLGQRLLSVGQDPGFFYLIGHGIPSNIIEEMFKTSQNFFDTLSDDVRTKYSARSGEPGYSGPGKEKLSGLGTGDLKESYHFKTFTSFPDVDLPSELARRRTLLLSFSRECERVGEILLEGFATGLNLPVNFLTKAHTGEQNRFRMLHYPALSSGANLETARTATKDDIRAGAHSDYGSVTLLFQQRTDEGGLQVWHQEKWVDVPAIQDAIVVNIGDALEFWTAGRLRSTIHRVTFPRCVGPVKSRYSIPFFVTADDDTVLEPLMQFENGESGKGLGFDDLVRVKGYVTDRKITAKEHRVQREIVFGGNDSVTIVV